MKRARVLAWICGTFSAAFLYGAASGGEFQGDWIKPAWPDGKQPQFPNRAFCWTAASAMPNKVVVYRKKVIVSPRPRKPLRADIPWEPLGRGSFGAIRIVSTGHVYVFINGREVYASDTPKDSHVVILSPFLSLGEHVVLVSASEEGFAMAGFYEDVNQGSIVAVGRTPLVTDTTWKVNKFPPTTALELEPCSKPGFDDSEWFSVTIQEGKGVEASTDVLVAAIWRDEILRLCHDIDEAEWRLGLIAQKGIAIIDDIAYYGWGPHRISPAVLSAAKEGLSWIPEARAEVAEVMLKEVDNWPSFVLNRQYLHKAMAAAFRLNQLTQAATNILYLVDELRNLANCSLLLRKENEDFALDYEGLATKFGVVEGYLEKPLIDWAHRNALYYWPQVNDLRKRIEQAWGHPLNRYNESRFSPMGWIPNSGLVDGELADWGLHVGEVEAPAVVPLARRWRFSLDPGNEGLSRGWHTIGFNIEGQWPLLDVPGAWDEKYKDVNRNAAAQNPYPNEAEVSNEQPYNGFAWYRTRVRVPEEWRGNDLELRFSWADDWDWTYFNEKLVGKTGPEKPDWTNAPRLYRLPKDLVKFGEENVIAVRVFDAGGRGGLGSAVVRCPGLIGGGTSQPVSVVRSFLSPGILLEARGRELTIWGKKAAGGHLLLPLSRGRVGKTTQPGQSIYSLSRDGKLAENWLLWLPGFEGADAARPIEIVLESNPEQIDVTEETDRRSLKLVFSQPGVRAVLVRPFAVDQQKGMSPITKAQLAACRFWSRALLEYPLDYTEMTRLDPADRDFVQVFNIYNYRSFRNEWGIKPLRLAPAPVFLTYALKTAWPGLSVSSKLTDTGFDLGKYGTYHAVADSNVISYRYPRDKILRLGGFTSWVFMTWDAGVPGNDRESEVIAQTGSNSYRPQHNFAREKPRIFADWCNKYGINYMNNPDNELGGKGGKRGENVDAWVNHYRELAWMFKDYPEYAVAFDLINEAANMKPEVYNPLIKRLTDEIRKIDPVHLIYVETCNSWGAVEQFPNLAVTGDPRTIYSFHDYNFRLRGDDRWPSMKWDIRQMYKRWMPAFDFQLENHVPLHLGEFGGYEKGGEFNPCAVTMLHDTFRILDQFNWHFNYYPGRGIMWPRADGSLRPNAIVRAFKRYFDLGNFNRYFTSEERTVVP